MVEASAGLELPIGLTEQKFLQQLAKIEARTLKASRAMQQSLAKANADVTDSSVKMGAAITRQTQEVKTSTNIMRGNVSNIAAQFNDIGVTAASGMNPLLIALQQGTQLSQVFAQQGGGLRAVAGSLAAAFGSIASPVALVTLGITAVAAAAIQAGVSFLSFGGKSEDLEKSISSLESAVDDYRASVELANSPTAVLAEKYGIAASRARELLEVISQINRIEAGSKLAAGADAIASKFDGLIERFANLDRLASSQDVEIARVNSQIERMATSFGLTVDQARTLAGLLQDQQAAKSLEEQSTAIQAIATFLGDAAEQANYQNAALNEAAKAANQAAAEGLRLEQVTRDASAAATDLGSAIMAISFGNAIAGAEALSSRISGLIGQARTMLSVLGQAQAANMDAGKRRELVELERDLVTAGKSRVEVEGQLAALRKKQDLDAAGVGLPVAARDKLINDAKETAAATQSAMDDIAEYNKAVAEAERAASKGAGKGGRKTGGGGRAKKREEPGLFDNAEKQLTDLQRQIDLIGKNTVETARMRAEWAMLDEAKRRGVPVNDQLNVQIAAQADQIGQLTSELEQAKLAQDQFDQAVEGIATAFSNAILQGENLRDSLANIFKQIAANILNAGIQNALKTAFSGAGQGGGFWGLLAGAFGGTKAAIPGYASGGMHRGGLRIVGEDGPELEATGPARIFNASQTARMLAGGIGRSANSRNVNMTIDLRGTTGDKELDRKIAAAGRQILSQVPDYMSEVQRRRPGPWGN